MNGFREFWEKYKDSIENVLRLQSYYKDFATSFDGDIEKVLMLLKMLPAKQCGRKTAAHRPLFQESVDKVIIFSKVENILIE